MQKMGKNWAPGVGSFLPKQARDGGGGGGGGEKFPHPDPRGRPFSVNGDTTFIGDTTKFGSRYFSS